MPASRVDGLGPEERLAEALRQSEERLRLAVEAGQLGIWDWNIVEDRISWSDRVYELHGVPLGKFGGRLADFARLVHPDDAERIQQTIEASLRTGNRYEAELRVPLPDGRVRCLATRAEVIRDAAGKPLRMIGATYDVTERVELRQARAEAEAARRHLEVLAREAEQARRAAEDASRAKDEFLAILGHELRNPLTPIVAALEIMELRDEGAARREREIIQRQVNHLSRLVDDLLDVSRIVRGKVELARHRLDFRAVILHALEMTRPLFTQREVEVDVDLGTARAWVIGDHVRLAQVAGNLLTNAAKFTPPGGRVQVTLRRGELVVRDSGEGIAPELLPRIFDLFVQGAQSLDRGQGGLGLGLAIVHNLVDLHGGTVVVESDGAGTGTTFWVRLPLADSQEEPPAAPARKARTRGTGRLLLVDDNLDAAELLGELLRNAGYELTVVGTGADALRAAEREPPALAILDIGLPGMDGYELARRLRARSSPTELRLIAITGYGLDADRQQAVAAGFDHYLVKPVRAAALLETIAALLSR